MPVVEYDLLRDSRHRDAAAAGDQRAWLSWLELGGTRPRTLYDYEWATAALLRMFPATPFPELDDAQIMACLRQFPPRSRRIRRAAFASWFKWGRQTRRRPDNPMELVPEMRVVPQVVHDVFDEAEVELLCGLPHPDGTLMHVLFATGIRKGEARKLRWQHIDVATSRLTVHDGKGGKNRVIPFGDIEPFGLQYQLADWQTLDAPRPTDHLWYDRPGGTERRRHHATIGEGSFARWWDRCLNAADVRYRNPHQTRHTFATRLRQRGLAIDDIQILLGHSSIATTRDLYVHTQIEDVVTRLQALRGE